jgi:hypothetical protein
MLCLSSPFAEELSSDPLEEMAGQEDSMSHLHFLWDQDNAICMHTAEAHYPKQLQMCEVTLRMGPENKDPFSL